MKSLDAHYANIALKTIQEIQDSDETLKSNFGGLCHHFPAMVRLNGLRLTVAFFEAKKKKNTAYGRYLCGIEEALSVSNLSTCIPNTGVEYRSMTEKALRASIWFKRYTEAILHIDQASDTVQEGDI